MMKMNIMVHTLHTLDLTQKSHLKKVIGEMRVLGAPVIRVVDLGGCYQAIEGQHRLVAAEILGLAPTLVVLEEGDRVKLDSLDIEFDDPYAVFKEAEDGSLVSDALDLGRYLHNPGGDVYQVCHDGKVTNINGNKFMGCFPERNALDYRYVPGAEPGNEGKAIYVAIYEGMPMGGWTDEDGVEEFREIVLNLLEDFYDRQHEEFVRSIEREREQVLRRIAFGELDDGTIGFPEIVDLPDDQDLEAMRHVVDPALLMIERVQQPLFKP